MRTCTSTQGHGGPCTLASRPPQAYVWGQAGARASLRDMPHDASDPIRIAFPVYGELSTRARSLLSEGVKQGGLFIRASDLLEPGRALDMAFVGEDGREHFLLHTFVTKVRRAEPHDQVFICFAQLNDARDALRKIEGIASHHEATIVKERAQSTPEEGVAVAGPPTVEDSRSERAIIVVHPDLVTRETISQDLQAVGFQVCTADDGLNALMALEAFPASAIVTWARVGRLAGYELPGALRSRSVTRSVAVVVLTAAGDEEAAVLSQQAGADAILEYPMDIDDLGKAIRDAIRIVLH